MVGVASERPSRDRDATRARSGLHERLRRL